MKGGHTASWANYEMCRVLLQVPRSLTGIQMPTETKDAETFLAKLRQWASALPLKLRLQLRQKGNTFDAESKRMKIRSLYYACSYYNAVIVVTRSALASSVISSLPVRSSTRQAADALDMSRREKLEEPSRILAETCVSAAVHMMQVCRDAVYLGLLFGNTCILQ